MSRIEQPQAEVFAALGDATRLSLLDRLGDGRPRSLADLAEGRPMSRQAVSKHLRVLEGAGLVARRSVGRETRFALRPQPINEAADYLERVGARWDEALARLASHLED